MTQIGKYFTGVGEGNKDRSTGLAQQFTDRPRHDEELLKKE
jgi:hypothetical protein